MVIYENAALWSKKRGFFDKGTYEVTDELTDKLHVIANELKDSVYLIREFIVVDAEYQDQAPSKCAKDWYVLKIDPSD